MRKFAIFVLFCAQAWGAMYSGEGDFSAVTFKDGKPASMTCSAKSALFFTSSTGSDHEVLSQVAVCGDKKRASELVYLYEATWIVPSTGKVDGREYDAWRGSDCVAHAGSDGSEGYWTCKKWRKISDVRITKKGRDRVSQDLNFELPVEIRR